MTNRDFIKSTAPLISFGNRVPENIRDWELVFKHLNLWLRTNSNVDSALGKIGRTKALVDDTATLNDRTTTDLGILTDLISDVGRAANQRFIHPLYSANRNSVQSADTVITATSSASDSAIALAAHSVKFDFGTVAYNSGNISGLVAETLYYVYADDPDYAGGAVSYLATTNPDNLIAQGRYYVGFVTTPVTSASSTVNAATSANPIQITTAAAHGLVNGQTVTFASMPGDFGTNLNGNNYVITYVNTTQFTIAVNGTGYAAYTTGGTVTRVTSATQTGGGAGAGVGGRRFDYR